MCAEAARAPLKIADSPRTERSSALSESRTQPPGVPAARSGGSARSPQSAAGAREILVDFGSNIDEFFMVRVAGVMQQIENGVQETGHGWPGPSETLDAIRAVVGRLVNGAYDFFREDLIPAPE
jgi:hypothetical protein